MASHHAQGESRDEAKWQELLPVIDELFGDIAALNEPSDIINRPELTRVYGIPGVFDELFSEHGEEIRPGEWREWLRETHVKKGVKGAAWLEPMLHTMRKSLDEWKKVGDGVGGACCALLTQSFRLMPSFPYPSLSLPIYTCVYGMEVAGVVTIYGHISHRFYSKPPNIICVGGIDYYHIRTVFLK